MLARGVWSVMANTFHMAISTKKKKKSQPVDRHYPNRKEAPFSRQFVYREQLWEITGTAGWILPSYCPSEWKKRNTIAQGTCFLQTSTVYENQHNICAVCSSSKQLNIWRKGHIQVLHKLLWFCPCWKDICLFIKRIVTSILTGFFFFK